MKVLIIEDDISLNQVLEKRLKANGFTVETSFNGEDGLEFARTGGFDIIISDIMMPKMDGLEFLKRLRQEKCDVPVLFLTAKDKSEDVVHGLDLGADDYMLKPFDFSELLARIRLLTRRRDGLRDAVYTVGNLTIDTLGREVKRNNIIVPLTFKEYELLLLLVRNKNTILSRDKIMSSLYNWDTEIESNTIDVYIRYLRKKIDDDYEDKIIQTVRGVGYTVRG